MTRYSEESTTCSSMDVNSLISVGPQSLSRCEKLVVNAMGTNVQVDMQYAHSLSDLQSALQTILQMEGQSFAFYDVSGMTLSTDGDVHDAVAKGLTPLNATLTDAAIHHIENRREELAQMQWKLVRDQMTVANGKMSALARQCNDTKGQLEKFRQETTNAIERGQKETLWSIESVQKQLDNVSDTLETERGARRQDVAMHMSIIQDLRGKLDAERVAREELKDQHAFEIRSLVEKADAFQKHVTDMLRDQHMGVAKTVDGLHKQFQGNVRLLNQLRADVDQTQQETKTHFVEIEEGCSGLETRIADMSKKQSATTERFAERQERIAQLVQTLQNDGKQCQDQVLVALNRTADLEARLQDMETMTRNLVVQEREGRDDQMRRTQRVLHCEQKRQLSELEEKIASRLERESHERERHVQAIFEEVGKSSPRVVRSVSTSKVAPATRIHSDSFGQSETTLATFGEPATIPQLTLTSQQAPGGSKQLTPRGSQPSTPRGLTRSHQLPVVRHDGETEGPAQIVPQMKTTKTLPAPSPIASPRGSVAGFVTPPTVAMRQATPQTQTTLSPSPHSSTRTLQRASPVNVTMPSDSQMLLSSRAVTPLSQRAVTPVSSHAVRLQV
mmetsp:Transcript_123691/g.231412  ORF Transcript_123691/g.231412 Transcript_123691/m.231412 type:complete len:616 (+) Transcript_123691:54-1901(+)